MLLKYETEIHVVKLPEHVAREKRIISYSSWGEVSAKEFAGFLSCEKVLTKDEIRMYAMRWSELFEENSPLRTVINGKVMGVPENFYDFLLWKKITRKPIKEARIIGDILGCYRLGVGDWWYARRIDYHIQQGNITIANMGKGKNISMETLVRICEALNCSIWDVIELEQGKDETENTNY